jgi:hypothetical protein
VQNNVEGGAGSLTKVGVGHLRFPNSNQY